MNDLWVRNGVNVIMPYLIGTGCEVTEMTIIELFERNGKLWYHGQEEWMGEKDKTVLVRYTEVDYDTFNWPLDTTYRTAEKQMEEIAHAMYDARETGDIPADTGVIVLPDGTRIEV